MLGRTSFGTVELQQLLEQVIQRLQQVVLPPPDRDGMYSHPAARERLVHAALVWVQRRRRRRRRRRMAPRAAELPARLHLPVLHGLDVPPSAHAHDVPRKLPQDVDVVWVEVAVEDEQDGEYPGTQVRGVWIGVECTGLWIGGGEVSRVFEVHVGCAAFGVEGELVGQAVDLPREVV